MPPCTPACGLGRVCFFTTFTPDTISLPLSSTLRTLPRLPLSLPARTITSSSRLIFNITLPLYQTPESDNFRRQGYNLHELVTAKFTRHRSEDTRAYRCFLIVQDHCRVIVKLDQRAVGAAHTLSCPNHHRSHYLALFDLAPRNGLFNRHLDQVADSRIAPLLATQHLDA